MIVAGGGVGTARESGEGPMKDALDEGAVDGEEIEKALASSGGSWGPIGS